MYILNITRDSIIDHLGKNPKKGGNPPIESREINNESLIR